VQLLDPPLPPLPPLPQLLVVEHCPLPQQYG
jgi:hypothetical protein